MYRILITKRGNIICCLTIRSTTCSSLMIGNFRRATTDYSYCEVVKRWPRPAKRRGSVEGRGLLLTFNTCLRMWQLQQLGRRLWLAVELLSSLPGGPGGCVLLLLLPVTRWIVTDRILHTNKNVWGLTRRTAGSTGGRRCSRGRARWLPRAERPSPRCRGRTPRARRRRRAARGQADRQQLQGPASRRPRSWAARATRTRLPSCSSRRPGETRPRHSQLGSSG